MFKTTRRVLAALALALVVTACSSDVTGPTVPDASHNPAMGAGE